MLRSFLRFIELRGIQASGKTTLARDWQKQYSNLARVNRDDLRNMLFGDSYKLFHEPVIVEVEKTIAKVCIEKGYSVVVDDTNLTGSPQWKDLAAELNIGYDVLHLDISVEEAIRRDSQRPNPVGERVIRATAKRARV